MAKTELSVGELSLRSGLPVSTLHFYERRGLIASERTSSNHRVYRREILRRVTVIKIAQSAGILLAEIADALSQLPRDTSPDTHDWERIAENWHYELTRRIELLTALRDKMAMCIGCGCLSVKRCPLVNADDYLVKDGPGARLLQDRDDLLDRKTLSLHGQSPHPLGGNPPKN